jgi:hypothetical protein
MRSAVSLIELARPRIDAGDYDDPATLQPTYLRRPAITKPKRQKYAKETQNDELASNDD